VHVQKGETHDTGTARPAGSVVAALLGSAVVDRLGFKRISVVSDLASSIAVALIPLLYRAVGLPF
jgi:hypothetical protein